MKDTVSFYDSAISFNTKKPYKCDRGHTWECAYLFAGISIQLPSGPNVPYCIYCLAEWAAANLGVVTEVTN